MSFLVLLTLLFITLKLTGVIAWSWFLIVLPLLFLPLTVLGLFLLGALAVLFGATRDLLMVK